MSLKVLATGGAGYIGSHTVKALLDHGFKVVILDNFYSGRREAIDARSELVEGSVHDTALLRRLMMTHEFCGVLHFAAHIEVEESVHLPLKYYNNNVAGTLSLLEACVAHSIPNFLFSSTAAVYGAGSQRPSCEGDLLSPLNPYGHSKLICEEMIRSVANKMNHVILRYFNAAGAAVDGTLGQSTPRATHLIKVAAEVACGVRSELKIFGTDYATPDGTCVRDYIHIDDLAMAHVEALRHLLRGGKSRTYNCGYGRGASVLEIISVFEDILGRKLPTTQVGRRPGDSPMLIADNSLLLSELDWRPRYRDYRVICETALRWEISLHTSKGTQARTAI